jgi:hypothetical protein
MLAPRALGHILPTLPRAPFHGPWYRAVNYDLLSGPPPGAPAGSAGQPLWPGGAALRGARFTPYAPQARSTHSGSPAVDSLYLAEDELTPLLEVTSVLRPPGSAIPLVFGPQVMLTVEGVVTDILDLTNTSHQSALGTSHQELTGPWAVQQAMYLTAQGPEPPTQMLGRAAFADPDILGLRYPSSKNPRGVVLVIFTAKMVQGRHSLKVHNQPGGKLQQSLP